MLPAGDLAKIAELCGAIGNEVTDETGFVPIRHLLDRFHASLLIRPLLVEGMLASLEGSASETGSRWAVLVDHEKYPYSQHDIDEERQTRQLPARMRNTIAHELVHSLAFRSSEFGVQLKARSNTPDGLRELVQAIERETERLSPLLLWPEKAIQNLLRDRRESLSLTELLRVMETAGISRYVLVNRLAFIQPATDENALLFSAGLRNLAIGVGVWGVNNSYLKEWPLFRNFDDGAVPSFLLRMIGHDRVAADALFADKSFAMLGGLKNAIEFETDAGTRAAPKTTRMKIQVEVEEVLREPGEEFLIVARKTAF
jgi:hypothetical protein